MQVGTDAKRLSNDVPQTLCGSAASLSLLLLAHVDRLSNRLDRSQMFRYEALAKHPGVILFGPGLPGYRTGMQIREAIAIACAGRWPEVIVHGVDFKESGIPLVVGLDSAPAITVLELQDSWTLVEHQAAFINEQRFDYALLIVRHHLPTYQELCPRTQFVWTPHAINTEIYNDYGLQKDIDVLLYGNLAAHTYPFRARLAELLANQWDLRVKIVPHPGYYPTETERSQSLVGSALAQTINRSWVTIVTSSIYRCVMMKYYEAAACRSLIAGDMPDEGRLIFGDAFLELRPEQSNWEIMEALRQALADKERLMEKIDAAHQRVLRDYSTDAFARQILQLFAEAKASRESMQLGTQRFVEGEAPRIQDRQLIVQGADDAGR